MASNALASIAAYNDSDSDSDTDSHKAANGNSQQHHPPYSQTSKPITNHLIKHKRLPPLDSNLSPLLHSPDSDQPLKKSKITPGEWLCHVFVQVPVHEGLEGLIQRCCSLTQTHLQKQAIIHSLIQKQAQPGCTAEASESDEDDQVEASSDETLHISLTRPILVRAHERQLFIQESKEAILQANLKKFQVAFSRISHLVNHDTSRDFLVYEIGMGWKELHAMSQSLTKQLYRAFKAKGYYQEARFHASIGYVDSVSLNDHSQPKPTDVAPLQDVYHLIETELGDQLRRSTPLTVGRIGIRVGKWVTWCDL